jgi:hypothetical protein
MREIAATVEHAPELACADVGLPLLAHRFLLVVGVHGRFAALPAGDGRDTARSGALSPGLLLALDRQRALRLDVRGLVALDLHAIVALVAGGRIPGARGTQDGNEDEQSDHGLAACALLLLRGDLDDVLLALSQLARSFGMIGKLRKLGPFSDGGVPPIEAVDQPIVFVEALPVDVPHELHRRERTMVHPALVDEVARPRVALQLRLELRKLHGLRCLRGGDLVHRRRDRDTVTVYGSDRLGRGGQRDRNGRRGEQRHRYVDRYGLAVIADDRRPMGLGHHAGRRARARDLSDRLRERTEIVRPALRVDDQADREDRLQLLRHTRHDVARAAHVAPHALARDHLVQDRADGVDVAPRIVELAGLRLGR